MKIKISVILWIILFWIGGCAKKGPPVPWESIVPKRIVDLMATPIEGRLLLEWTVPKENTDKSPLIDLSSFQIFRSEGILIGDECKGCGDKPKMVYEVKIMLPKEVKRKRMAILLEDHEPRRVYVYQVVSVNKRGYLSSPSNPITIYWDHWPPPPQRVNAEGGDKRVDLQWESVEGATGYNIYRRLENEDFSLKPINRTPLTTNQYSDLNVENERRYFYSVRALKKVVKTDVEGKGSLEIGVTPTDLISPRAPIGLVAIPLKDGVELNWRKNQEPDLLGYYVYRREAGETEFRRLIAVPLSKEIYFDHDVLLEHEYEYAVTAVDHSIRRNESPFSEEVRIKYIY